MFKTTVAKWDGNMLFNWLRAFPYSDPLFDKSSRAALILLLASGHVIHDFTLLDISNDNFIGK